MLIFHFLVFFFNEMYHVTQKLQEIKHAYGSLFCIYYKKINNSVNFTMLFRIFFETKIN